VLYRSLPELHRRQDIELGYPLAKLVEGQRVSFEELRQKIQQFGDLRDPLVVRSQYNETTEVMLGKLVPTKGAVIQRGFNGSVTAFGEFVSPTMRINSNMVNKVLEISRSTNPVNNRIVTIASVLEPTRTLTSPALSKDAGPLTWEIRDVATTSLSYTDIEVAFGDVSRVVPGWILFDGYAEYEVLARTQLPSRTEREGSDGLLGVGYLVLATSQFTMEDIGKRITIFGSATDTNNDRYEITNVRKPLVDELGYDALKSSYRLAELSRIGSSDYFDVAAPIVKDAGPLQWALLPRPQLSLKGQIRAVRGMTEQVGYEVRSPTEVPAPPAVAVATITALSPTAATVRLPSGRFSPDLSGGTAALSGTPPLVVITGLVGMEPSCIGRFITVSGAASPGNNSATATVVGPFRIKEYVNSGSVRYENQSAVLPDANNGNISWSYDSVDRGKILDILGPGTANGSMKVTAVSTLDTLVVGPIVEIPSLPSPFPLTDYAGPLEWELRTASAFGDLRHVQLRAPSLLQYLAQDFGVDVDVRETEDRQRSWVKNNAQWIGRKGTAKAYSLLGAISGFNITALALYRIAQDLLLIVPTADVYEVGEVAVGRSGTKGYLVRGDGGRVRFYTNSSDPLEQAVFKATDIGRQIRIRGSIIDSNNKLYTITTLVDSRTVEFRDVDQPTNVSDLSDPSSGSLGWSILRLYTTLPPTRPYYQHLAPDVMGQAINPKAWLNIPGVFPAGSLGYTAKTAGVFGNSITVTHVARGALSVSVTGTAITVTVVVGVTTAADVVTAVVASAPASALVTTAVQLGGSGFVSAFSSLSLHGGEDNFGLDRFCWEEDSGDDHGPFVSTIPNPELLKRVPPVTSAAITVLSVVAQAENLWTLTIQGPLNAVLSVADGNWRLTTNMGQPDLLLRQDLFLESTPIETSTPGQHTVTVFYGAEPVVGEAALHYDCSVQPSCDYCPASKVLLHIEYGAVRDDPNTALELVLNRMMHRIEQVTPAHVETVARFSSTVVATGLNITAEISAGQTRYDFIAPLQAYFDDITGDMVYPIGPITDTAMLRATVEVPTGSITALVGTAATISGIWGPIGGTAPTSITISGAANAANNGTFTVVGYVDSSTPIPFQSGAYTISDVNYTNAQVGATASDTNNGHLIVTLA
jgi:hypothetical protein